MRLTLLRAKEAVRHRVPETLVEARLNRVCERLLTHGKYTGSIQRLAISAPYGQLTPPRAYRTIEGVKVNGAVHEMGNQWYEFLPGKSDMAGYYMDAVRDLGDGWAIMRTPRITPPTTAPDVTVPVQDIPDGGTITVGFPGSNDPTLTVLIEGRDSNGLPISLSFAGQQTLANVFTRISRIHKEQGTRSVTITYTTDDAVATVIAIMEPKEEETYYRRYIIDSHVNEPTLAVACLCKRRHIEFTSDTDILPFSNIYALERGLDALQYEDENDVTLADQYWDKAVAALNDELKDTNSDNSFPIIRFIYPGHSYPNYTSHY